MAIRKKGKSSKIGSRLINGTLTVDFSEIEGIDRRVLESYDELRITGCQNGILDLRFLDGVSSLVELIVVDNTSRVTTHGWILPSLPSIKYISLDGIRPTSQFIDTISNWNIGNFSLNRIRYEDDMGDAFKHLRVNRFEMKKCVFSTLPRLRYVEIIVIDDCVIGTLDLENLSSKYLKSLTLKLADYSIFSNEHLRQIRLLPSLEELVLRDLKFGRSVQDVDYSILDGHQGITRLVIPGFKSAFGIPRLPNIKDLWLNCIEVEGIDLAPLTNSSDLRYLMINTIDNHIPDKPLEHLDFNPLASCANLKEIELSSTGIEEVDLTPLLHIESLVRIWTWNLENIDTRFTAESRLKDTMKSPAIKEKDRAGEIEWK